MSTLTNILDDVIALVKDDAGILTDPNDYESHVKTALARYSIDRPGSAVVDIVGDSGHDYDLPAGWVQGFSKVECIEYPVGNVPADYLDAGHFLIYREPTGDKLRLLSVTPTAAESFRVTYTVARTATSVLDNDVEPFKWLVAALCCEQLANSYTQTSDPSIKADSVDYNSKGREYASRATRLKKQYLNHLGLKDGPALKPASAILDTNTAYPDGRPRLTHRRRR